MPVIPYTFSHGILYCSATSTVCEVSSIAGTVGRSILDAPRIFLSPTSASRVPAEATGRQ